MSILLVFTIILLVPSYLNARDVAGSIDKDVTWCLRESPFHVVETVVVERGMKLNIEPGVELQFEPGTGMIIDGVMVARGTSQDSIRFLSVGNKNNGAWCGIILRGSGERQPWDDQGAYTGSGSVLEYCIIEYAGEQTLEFSNALELSTSTALITNTTIRNSQGKTGTIRCANVASIYVINSFIHNNTAERGGAISMGFGSSCIIHDNVFAFNTASDHGGAIYLSLATSAVITDNSFIGNEAGGHGGAINAAIVSNMAIHRNAFLGNKSGYGSPVLFFTEQVDVELKNNIFDSPGVVIYLQRATNDIQANGNWWADPRTYDFTGSIHDRFDDGAEPYVLYDPPLWAPGDDMPTNPSRVNSIILCRNESYTEEIPYGVAEGAPLRIRLDAVDSDPFYPDLIQVRVISAMDSAGIVIPLRETAANSGIFTGRGDVAAVTSQESYSIGDQTGGRVTIFAPFMPEVRAEYETMSPHPFAEDFTMPDEADIQHVLNHNPRFTWTYFEVVERPQTHYQMQVFAASPVDSVPGELVWDSGEVPTDMKEATYRGAPLEEGQSYLVRLRVYSGYLWSVPVEFSFRMNSLPTAPQVLRPEFDELTDVKQPWFVAAVSQDREQDALTYSVEVFDWADPVSPVQQIEGVKCKADEVRWKPPAPLTENSSYQFRVRAVDPFEQGPWSDFRTFHVNSKQEPPGEFAPQYPIDQKVIYQLNPTLTWETSRDPDPLSSVTYIAEISKQPGFGTSQRYDGISTTQFRLPDSLDNRSEYCWRITAVDNTGLQTVTSTAGRFYVDTTPSTPSIVTPANGEERLPNAVLSWQASTDPNPDDIITYEIEVYDSQDLKTCMARLDGWSSINLYVNRLHGWDSLVDNKVYYWRVRAWDNHRADSYFSSPGSFFFNRYNDPPNPVPAVTSPENIVTGTSEIHFGWQEASDIDLSDTPATLVYEIEATTTDFETGDVRRFTSKPGHTEHTESLDDNLLWRYRIRARDDEGAVSEWNVPRTVLLNIAEDPPARFNLSMPYSNDRIVELDSLMFTWNSSSDPDWESRISYRLEISGETGDEYKYDLTGTEFHFREGLKNESAYRWRVVAIDNTGLETVCSEENHFTTTTTPTAPGTTTIPAELMPDGSLVFLSAGDPNQNDRLTYTLEVSPTIQFDSPAIQVREIPHSSGIITAVIKDLDGSDKLEDDSDYYYRARATDNHGYSGPFSSPVGFRFNRQNDPPTLPGAPYAPTGGNVIRERNPELTWSPASDEDLSDPTERLYYDVRLDSDNELEQNTKFAFETPAGVTQYRIPVPLEDNTPWVWQVRARDDDQATSSWSPVQSVLLNMAEDPPSRPVAIAPYNGQVLNILGPIQFKWTQSIDPDYLSTVQYSLEYSVSPDFNGAIRIDNVNSATCTVEGPLENTTYYWRCIAIDNTNLETVSDAVSFTLNTRPSVPQPLSPLSRIELTPGGALKFTPSADPNPNDVITYTVEIAVGEAANAGRSQAAFESRGHSELTVPLAEAEWNMSQLLNAFGDNRICHWRVRAVDNNGIASAWSPAAEFFFNSRNDPPDAVGDLTAPAEGAEVSLISLNWTPAQDPDPSDTPERLSYKIELSTDVNFMVESIVRTTPPGFTNLQVSGLTDNTTWYWRVSAIDDERSEGPASRTGSFIYNSRNDSPDKFNLLEPAKAANVGGSELTFRWQPATDPDPGDVVTYAFYIARDAGFSLSPQRIDKISVTEYTVGQDVLTGEGMYFWKVSAEDGEGGMTWGSGSDYAPWNITVKLPPPPQQSPSETQDGE